MKKGLVLIALLAVVFSCALQEIPSVDQVKENISVQLLSSADTGNGYAKVTYRINNKNDFYGTFYNIKISLSLTIKDTSGKSFSKIDQVLFDSYLSGYVENTSYILTYSNPDIPTTSISIEKVDINN